MSIRKQPSPPRRQERLVRLAATAACLGVEIGDTEDMAEKEKAFDEWVAGKLQAICAGELKRGDMMRDSAGGTIRITGAYLAGGGMVFVQAGSLSMHIPQTGMVFILPNDEVLLRLTGGADWTAG